MKISGFTMAKNVDKLYYPIRACIESVLPIVDEFIVAMGDCDEDDNTRLEIEKINSSKIRIIDTVWDLDGYPNGTENAHQTDLAKEACTGDWLFYLQADEVVHEKYLDTIVKDCQRFLEDKMVEGFLFNYVHFWGDYDHYQSAHGWYPKEIRIIRNRKDIHSWESAQSFRRIPNFDYVNYRQQDNTFKLHVIESNAYIYHYGWVRPPRYMQSKRKSLETIHKGKKVVDEAYAKEDNLFDYGSMKLSKVFKGTHPAVMEEWIEKFDWGNILYHQGPIPTSRPKFKHEKFKYRVLTFIEQNLLGGRHLFAFKNYIKLPR